MLMDREILQARFDEALPYTEFVRLGEPEAHRPPWDDRYGQLALSEEQAQLVRSFKRKMNVLCLTGTWCGDCALQGSAMQRIAEANPACIDLRFVLRSEDQAELVTKAAINAGYRVPVTWFMAEDFEPAAWFGDRTLSRYRSMARKGLPPQETAAIPPAPADPVREVLQEVLNEFERVQLLFLLSPRLQALHVGEG